MMKKFALWSLALLLTFAAACSDYDDTELWNSVNDIKKRVEALETAVAKLNSDVSAMQTLIEKLNEKVYVSKVETNADGSYTIYFTDPENTKITITNGKDGAAAPVIGVAKDTDEIYYWTLTSGGGEPEWLLADGKKIPLTPAPHDSLAEASIFVEVIEKRQGLKIACLEGIAYHNGWITAAKLRELAQPMLRNQYGQYLLKLTDETE